MKKTLLCGATFRARALSFGQPLVFLCALASPADADMLHGIVTPLAAKAREIEADCGSRVISGYRHTRIAGTEVWSLHALGRAVDMQGNPGCIYAHLRDWPGGVSIDYSRVRHVHFSYAPDGMEWGARFAHRDSGYRRFAHRRWRYVLRRR